MGKHTLFILLTIKAVVISADTSWPLQGRVMHPKKFLMWNIPTQRHNPADVKPSFLDGYRFVNSLKTVLRYPQHVESLNKTTKIKSVLRILFMKEKEIKETGEKITFKMNVKIFHNLMRKISKERTLTKPAGKFCSEERKFIGNHPLVTNVRKHMEMSWFNRIH